MNRYYFYPVFMCMLTNTLIFIPSILIKQRFHGAVPAILISILLGYGLAHLFTKGLTRFPGQGLPEILAANLPAPIRIIIVFFLAFMWLAAGSIVLISYCHIIQRFVNPDFNLFLLIAFIGMVCAWTATNPSKTVLYITEIVLLLNLPIIIFIVFKAILSENMNWDAVKVMRHYLFTFPSWKSLTASTYVFTGYVNWAIFNREFQSINLKKQHLWVIPIIGSLVLTTTFLIPIGYYGTYGVEDFVYIWVSTADSMKMEFGFMERVMFIFLLLYLSVALLFISITWHVGSELTKNLLPPTTKPFLQQYPTTSGMAITGMTVVLAELFALMLDEKHFMMAASNWLQLRLPSEIFIVLLVYGLGMRRQQQP
ncbi:GerAB/ArcD/ProY family transporter [Paenibacillus aestuarii]|uniref:GerAB/ArcD/ProY family transporter n=1 Tax=Paenibacillus aestuarii TaxID=516965 RepID=A0ABW0K3T9_9BACL|nr:GerAB/ArcD/ProY family transporter [Paenibacillus aestuarii]